MFIVRANAAQPGGPHGRLSPLDWLSALTCTDVVYSHESYAYFSARSCVYYEIVECVVQRGDRGVFVFLLSTCAFFKV